jgi:hypothetical protein
MERPVDPRPGPAYDAAREGRRMDTTTKKCPRCGLANPGSAERCDCGYDFLSRTVEKPYYKQAIPKDLKTFIGVVIGLNALGLYAALMTGDALRIVFVVIWSLAVYFSYFSLLKKKNWARIALIIITFPWGLFLGFSREVKLFCLQKD